MPVRLLFSSPEPIGLLAMMHVRLPRSIRDCHTIERRTVAGLLNEAGTAGFGKSSAPSTGCRTARAGRSQSRRPSTPYPIARDASLRRCNRAHCVRSGSGDRSRECGASAGAALRYEEGSTQPPLPRAACAISILRRNVPFLTGGNSWVGGGGFQIEVRKLRQAAVFSRLQVWQDQRLPVLGSRR